MQQVVLGYDLLLSFNDCITMHETDALLNNEMNVQVCDATKAQLMFIARPIKLQIKPGFPIHY